MKLNYDCMRDILLALEKTKINESLSYKVLRHNLNYEADEIWYSCHLLYENGYISATCIDDINNCDLPFYPYIKELTLKGHEFLNSIRSNSIWEKVKAIAKKIGASSASAVAEIALSIGEETILKKFS